MNYKTKLLEIEYSCSYSPLKINPLGSLFINGEFEHITNHVIIINDDKTLSLQYTNRTGLIKKANFDEIDPTYCLHRSIETALDYKEFSNFIYSDKFLEKTLFSKPNTFFEDHCFRKMFSVLDIWIQASKNITGNLPEHYSNLLVKGKIAKTFIPKSTVSCFQKELEECVDKFIENRYSEFTNQLNLPF